MQDEGLDGLMRVPKNLDGRRGDEAQPALTSVISCGRGSRGWNIPRGYLHISRQQMTITYDVLDAVALAGGIAGRQAGALNRLGLKLQFLDNLLGTSSKPHRVSQTWNVSGSSYDSSNSSATRLNCSTLGL